MKKIFVLSMLVSFVMICSCQKQDSATEQQLAQRKTELDAREEALADRKSALDEREKAPDERQKALDERQKALDEREKSLAQKEQATMNAQTDPANVQPLAEAQAETDSETQQLATRVPDVSQAVAEKADKENEVRGAQQLPAPGELQSQKQRSADELQRGKQRIMDAARISPAPQ
jgi:chromosome segregation ATPase